MATTARTIQTVSAPLEGNPPRLFLPSPPTTAKNSMSTWHGTSFYDEQMHIPLIIKRAHEPRAGTVESRIARTLDIAPTLMAGAGLPNPNIHVGRDLFGAAPLGALGDEPLFAEEDLEGNVLASLRLGPWKLITANPGNARGLPPIELYNLEENPHERQSVRRLLLRLRPFARNRISATAVRRLEALRN